MNIKLTLMIFLCSFYLFVHVYGKDFPAILTPEGYLQEAITAYDSHEYKKCIQLIKTYEQESNRFGYSRTIEEQVTALAYKAYSKKYLKRYPSAIHYFREMIPLMKEGGYKPESLFYTYFEHACCYAAIGKRDECTRLLKKLVEMDIAPSINDLIVNDYKICHQPFFYDCELSVSDKLIINEIVATALGENMMALAKRGELIPLDVSCCATEEIDACRCACEKLTAYAVIISGFIPDKALQAAVLSVLAEFSTECSLCCEQHLGSKNCCRNIRSILENIGGVVVEGL